MADSTRPLAYSTISKIIHWLTAIIVISIIPAGIIMSELDEGPLQNWLFDMHRAFGVVVFFLALCRVLARRFYGVPAPYEGLTRFERIASTAAHHTLLALLFAMPLLGWMMMSTYRAEVSVFGLFTLPNILPENRAVYDVLAEIHEAGGMLMAVIIFVHAGAGLLHYYVRRDSVLQRMLLWSKS
jgi:cytochrome b561